MKSLHGRPHWAKNFTTVSPSDLEAMYGTDLTAWRRVRREVDPDGLFVGDWHRRTVLDSADSGQEGWMGSEETCIYTMVSSDGGVEWLGEQAARWFGLGSARGSEESFDVFTAAEAEASVLLESSEH